MWYENSLSYILALHIEKCWKIGRVGGNKIVSGLVPSFGITSHGVESSLQVRKIKIFYPLFHTKSTCKSGFVKWYYLIYFHRLHVTLHSNRFHIYNGSRTSECLQAGTENSEEMFARPPDPRNPKVCKVFFYGLYINVHFSGNLDQEYFGQTGKNVSSLFHL